MINERTNDKKYEHDIDEGKKIDTSNCLTPYTYSDE